MQKEVDRFNRLLAQAAKTNRERDQMERELGFATPNDGPPYLRLGTGIAAIEAGLLLEDWNAIAEGLDMLYKLRRDMKE